MVHQVTVTKVVNQPPKAITARHQIVFEPIRIKNQSIVLVAVRIGLVQDHMIQKDEIVISIRIVGIVTTIYDIEEAVNVAENVHHQEIIGAKANQPNVGATMIGQESWLIIKLKKNHFAQFQPTF